ncbi:hypothetical protein [Moorena sp. SIO4G3]|uniref:hypothetical protein n=1 Tax=Moorena sp. SIO4G3 TaxID=2607821 RepID=UPI00142B478B|nr:hypothetical protein [Moorena sp. SIO4G3]NEO80898.1 hypothetical protein [Moorena sp. SIO4G3]
MGRWGGGEMERWGDGEIGRFVLSDAARSWGGSAVLGVSPMSDCRGFPHERLHQDRVITGSLYRVSHTHQVKN